MKISLKMMTCFEHQNSNWGRLLFMIHVLIGLYHVVIFKSVQKFWIFRGSIRITTMQKYFFSLQPTQYLCVSDEKYTEKGYFIVKSYKMLSDLDLNNVFQELFLYSEALTKHRTFRIRNALIVPHGLYPLQMHNNRVRLIYSQRTFIHVKWKA